MGGPLGFTIDDRLSYFPNFGRLYFTRRQLRPSFEYITEINGIQTKLLLLSKQLDHALLSKLLLSPMGFSFPLYNTTISHK